MGTRNRSEVVIARLADQQYGVVARRQLLERRLTSKEVGGRLRRGLLVPLHRGVYAVGHRRLTRDGHWLAAVLAAGPGAVLSHRDAGALHGLGGWSTGRIEVTTAADVDTTPRLRVFARRTLDPADVTTIERIPVSTVARTLVDLAELLDRERLLHALAEAERAQQFDLVAVEAAVARVHGRRGHGSANLRAALEETGKRGLQLTAPAWIALRRLVRTAVTIRRALAAR